MMQYFTQFKSKAIASVDLAKYLLALTDAERGQLASGLDSIAAEVRVPQLQCLCHVH
jgi:hypothetical protein